MCAAMGPPAHLEPRQILHPAVFIVSGHNIQGELSSGDDDFVTQRDAAGKPAITFLYILLYSFCQNSLTQSYI